jgi:hypothetical protein
VLETCGQSCTLFPGLSIAAAIGGLAQPFFLIYSRRWPALVFPVFGETGRGFLFSDGRNVRPSQRTRKVGPTVSSSIAGPKKFLCDIFCNRA